MTLPPPGGFTSVPASPNGILKPLMSTSPSLPANNNDPGVLVPTQPAVEQVDDQSVRLDVQVFPTLPPFWQRNPPGAERLVFSKLPSVISGPAFAGRSKPQTNRTEGASMAACGHTET